MPVLWSSIEAPRGFQGLMRVHRVQRLRFDLRVYRHVQSADSVWGFRDVGFRDQGRVPRTGSFTCWVWGLGFRVLGLSGVPAA